MIEYKKRRVKMKIEKNDCLIIKHEKDLFFNTKNYLYDIYKIQMRAKQATQASVSVILNKDFITVVTFSFFNSLTQKVLTFDDFVHFIEKHIDEKITSAKSLKIIYNICFDYFIEVKGL